MQTFGEVFTSSRNVSVEGALAEDEAGPVVFFFLLLEGEAEGGGLFDEQGSIGGVETAEDEAGTRSHLLAELGQVVEQDVTVDVGQNEVERAFHLI